MTPCSYSELFEALATVGIRTVLREYFNDNSCINTTRVMLEIFRHFGLTARPFAVRTMIFSKAFVERADREGRIPQSDEEVRLWCAEPGVYSVGIGFGIADMPHGRWPGHLVVHAGQHYLFDATINQASRPARGIEMPDLLLLDEVPLAFWRGQGAAISNSPDGSIIRYEPDPANHGYLASPAWSLRPGIEENAYRDIVALLQTKGGLPRSRGTQPLLGIRRNGAPRALPKLSVEETMPDTKKRLQQGDVAGESPIKGVESWRG